MNLASATRTLAAASLIVLTGSLSAHAGDLQQPGFTGQWDLSTEALLPDRVDPCRFVGRADITQVRGQLSGVAMMTLVSGPVGCPAEMEADLTGTANFPNVEMGMLFGNLGEATFTGGIPGKGVDQSSLVGSFVVTVGPFANVSGPWDAVVADGIFKDSFESIVALTAGSSLLALGFGAFIHRRPA